MRDVCIITKHCTKCNLEKELSLFPFDSRRDKHHTVCRECRNAQSRAWHKANVDHLRECSKAYYHNTPFTRIFIKTCRVTGNLFVTPIASTTISPAARKQWTSYRYNKEKGLNKVRIKDKLMHDQHGRCVICNDDLSKVKTSLDHKIPVSKGGTDDISNLQLTCFTCNQIKGTHTDPKTVFNLVSQRKGRAG